MIDSGDAKIVGSFHCNLTNLVRFAYYDLVLTVQIWITIIETYHRLYAKQNIHIPFSLDDKVLVFVVYINKTRTHFQQGFPI